MPARERVGSQGPGTERGEEDRTEDGDDEDEGNGVFGTFPSVVVEFAVGNIMEAELRGYVASAWRAIGMNDMWLLRAFP